MQERKKEVTKVTLKKWRKTYQSYLVTLKRLSKLISPILGKQ